MGVKKAFLFLVLTAGCIGIGFLGATAYQFYRAYQKQLEKPPVQPAAAEKPVNPLLFFKTVTAEELTEFDRYYDGRQNELRDVIAADSQEKIAPAIEAVSSQLKNIEEKIHFFNDLTVHSEGQMSVKQALMGAYQLLKETYEKEIEFLKNYQTGNQNISFITGHIFEISSRDQRSGMQYLSSLMTYRKLLAEAIREDQSLEDNQARLKDLVTLNSMIEKYGSRLDIPAEAI